MKFIFEPVAPRSPQSEWSDWKWQIQNSLKSLKDFESFFDLEPEEVRAFQSSEQVFASSTTPYYATLCSKYSPIRKMAVPCSQELDFKSFYQVDPLGESMHSPVPRMIHRYPDRVLFLVTDFCGIYCRYCTRKYFTAQGKSFPNRTEYSRALDYIAQNQGIREVILSGGDPLTLSNNKLKKILCDLRSITHIEIIRIGSRMPVVCPFRIDQELIDILKSHQPIFIMTHFNHPKELTKECADHLTLLCDQGISVYNQMVLLNSINNHPAIVQALNRRLIFLRVRPYYMFQCDPSPGTAHFRTSIENSKWIQKELWGKLSGLALPRLSMDLPSGGGKVEIVPDHFIEYKDNTYFHKGFDGKTSGYVNQPHPKLPEEKDMKEYLEEWNLLKNQAYGEPLYAHSS